MGGAPPRGRRMFENFQESLKKIEENALFEYIFRKYLTTCANFSRIWTKNPNGLEIFEKILKIFDENSIEKLNF